MPKGKIEDVVFELSQPVAEQNGCEVVDVEFKKEGPNWFLRVFIDKENGITLDDCEVVSKGVSNELDRVDPIDQSYYLEVSSPGLDRPLKKEKDFTSHLGDKVEVKLYQPLNGSKLLIGMLEQYHDGSIAIQLEDNSRIELEKDKIALVRLAVDF
ncbi:ribosome maturation factor RimP [Petroclostridium sp. X23]|uniref:ribosome maturation factor RimP n=1 Tax=Petroclostridium sp. X23 TaxID=3045146 RepID=UPI0024ADAF29|nr:ribosome maturation factor RimP [Petroclostridium sp. X23]WHH58976.1 ribosome maturation factor RimP [Petroclostridium sp. X23]